MSEGTKASAPEGMDPFAASLALSGASRDKADAFLEDQRHHIHEQLKQIHLDIFEKWLGVALRLATLCVGIAVAAGVVVMVRDASNSNGLIVEPFSVPPDLAARGLTGQAVASQLLDKLAAMQNRTQSYRPAQSYANNWGHDLKVEIPETGISVGEIQRFLREWLGHDTHITGEIWRTSAGLSLTARAGGDAGEIVTGTEDDLNKLIGQVAENVYRVTQPYRYANYLDRFYQDEAPVPADAKSRVDRAEAIYKRLTSDPNQRERAWAWNGLGTQAWSGRGDVRAALDHYRKALSIVPDSPIWLTAYVQWTATYGHAEESLSAARRTAQLYPDNIQGPAAMAQGLGDFAKAAQIASRAMAGSPPPFVYDRNKWSLGLALAGQHDAKAARRVLAMDIRSHSPFDGLLNARNTITAHAAMGDWPFVVAHEPQVETEIRQAGLGWDFDTEFNRNLRPRLALAKSQLGDHKGAELLIGTSPLDCYDCVRIRGMIAAQGRQWDRADAWFAKAVQDGPSLPFAYADWGMSLLTRGQADAAIEKFRQANTRGPHFADPLEGWGEALMAKNQSHRALAKFAEAEKYAPNWGRLHLKWGQALVYSGKKEEGRAHLAKSRALDLTPSEKREIEEFMTKRI
jgi:tetratricopeptide (TPR) repeat protein